ncbi:hypothetical protein HMPREF3218_0202026 [Prevotella bivia]|nr:hypothetical protein HMPREF3218_0202026 [Prevotella bivia]
MNDYIGPVSTIFPLCPNTLSFGKYIDNQIIISITPDLEYYPTFIIFLF